MVVGMTGPSGYKSPYKKADCEWYPDVKPTTDYSGTTSGWLEIYCPVYVTRRPCSGRKWYYLATCTKCGGEAILSNVRVSKTCGCGKVEGMEKAVKLRVTRNRAAYPEGRRTTRESRKKRIPPGSNRLQECNHLPFQCRHYSQCQDERIETGRPSSRHQPGGGCYTAGRDELRHMEGV